MNSFIHCPCARRTAQRRILSHPRLHAQSGLFLIEALVAIALFAIGILGIVGVSARAIAAQSDAQYRSEAAAVANRVAQLAWLNVPRANGTSPGDRAAALATELAKFAHKPGGDACAFSGTPSENTLVTGWLTEAQRLPGATADMQQVRVETEAGFNKLTVTVCWKEPTNPVARRHVLATYVN